MNGFGKCLKIGQGMRLRQSLRKWRNLACTHVDVKKSKTGHRHPLTAVPPDVPSGHLAVYVGQQSSKRFVIRAAYLNHPMFRALLEQAEEEFGYGQQGGLVIPCDELLFEHILCFVARRRKIVGQVFEASSPLLCREICWAIQPPGMKQQSSSVGSC